MLEQDPERIGSRVQAGALMFTPKPAHVVQNAAVQRLVLRRML
jgi:hypothetical protein